MNGYYWNLALLLFKKYKYNNIRFVLPKLRKRCGANQLTSFVITLTCCCAREALAGPLGRDMSRVGGVSDERALLEFAEAEEKKPSSKSGCSTTLLGLRATSFWHH